MPYNLCCNRIFDWVILRINFLTHLSNVLDSAKNGSYNAVIVNTAPTDYISDCMMNFILKVNAAVNAKSTLQSFQMKIRGFVYKCRVYRIFNCYSPERRSVFRRIPLKAN